MRLGVIGGSFDPVHLGHLGVAEAAREEFELDRVVFVPAAQPPHKGGVALAPAADRLEMVKLAVAANPHFLASDVELQRKGPSYTIDTLTEISTLYPVARLFFIVGADSLSELHQWHRARELVERFDFIIVGRPGVEALQFERLVAAFGAAAAERLRLGYLSREPYNISATDIRARVAAGKSIRYLVTPAVERYIFKRGLYT